MLLSDPFLPQAIEVILDWLRFADSRESIAQGIFDESGRDSGKHLGKHYHN